MKQEALKFFSQVEWTHAGMFIFMAAFLGAFAWTCWGPSRHLHEHLSRLPLDPVEETPS